MVEQLITELDFFPDASPAIIGELTTGKTVHVELWKDGVVVSISASGCTEIDSTGQYTWSTSGIATLAASREQFHWRMSDGTGDTDEGDFVLISHENRDSGMPSLLNPSSYIVQI